MYNSSILDFFGCLQQSVVPFSVDLGAAPPPKETPAATAAVSEPKPPAKETPPEEIPTPSEIPTTPPPGIVTCRVMAWDQSP